MPSKKLPRPNLEGALSRIQAMAAMPRETPLERFVFEHFDCDLGCSNHKATRCRILPEC